VQIAMVSRGFTGEVPDDPTAPTGIDPWVLVAPLVASVVALVAVVS
jgi:hypothetical protein